MKTHHILIIALIGIVALAILYSGNITTDRSDATAAATQGRTDVEIPDSMTLRDRFGEGSLLIKLTGDDAGAFTFYVPDIGYYKGNIPLRFSGRQIVHPYGVTFADFTPLASGLGSTTQVRMEGEINYSHKTASLNVWVDGTKYRLIADAPDIKKAERQAEENAQTIVTRDWAALYSMLSVGSAEGLSQEEFAADMSASPHVLDVTIMGEGKLYEVEGHHFFTIDVQLTVLETDGTTQLYATTEYLILENGEWRLWTTSIPTPV